MRARDHGLVRSFEEGSASGRLCGGRNATAIGTPQHLTLRAVDYSRCAAQRAIGVASRGHGRLLALFDKVRLALQPESAWKRDGAGPATRGVDQEGSVVRRPQVARCKSSPRRPRSTRPTDASRNVHVCAPA